MRQEEVQAGIGAVTAGEGAAPAPFAHLLRSESGQCCLVTCPWQAQSAPGSWLESVFKQMVRLAGLWAAAVDPETHILTPEKRGL